MPSNVDNIAAVQQFLNNGNYAAGYRYIRDQVRNDPRYHPNLHNWFDTAADINGNPDSFIRNYVFTSNAIAAGLDPDDPLVLAENQRVSDLLAQGVLQDYINAEREGRVLTPEEIYRDDARAAVDEFGQQIGHPNQIAPHEWAGGVLGQLLYDFPVGENFQLNMYEKILQWELNALKTLLELAEDYADDVLQMLVQLNEAVGKLLSGPLPASLVIGNWLNGIFGSIFYNTDPLVLDLNGNDVSLTALGASNAYFDLNNNNFAEKTGWVSAGDGLLALDVNRNGRIDNGTELFGTATQNGFTVLARYDDNRDGQITNADAVWNSLLVWRDANGDGSSASAELSAITTNAITAINLNARSAGRGASLAGNPLLAVGNYTQPNGFNAEAIAVAFTTDQSDTRFVLPDGFEYDPEVFSLPNLRGYGTLPDLWVAMSLDPQLKAMVQQLVADMQSGAFENIGELVGTPFAETPQPYYRYGFLIQDPPVHHYKASAFENMLARWAGVPINDGVFVSDYDESQMRAVAERLLGRTFVDHSRLVGDLVHNPGFHQALSKMSLELATRFTVGLADIEENRVALDLFSDILAAAGDGTQAIDPATLQALIDQAVVDAGNQSPLPAFLTRYALLDYDFSTDSIGGDIGAFVDAELQAFDFDADHPWRGWTNWYQDRAAVLSIVDPDGAILDERRRAYTGNLMLEIMRPSNAGYIGMVSGTGIVNSNNVVGPVSGAVRQDLVTGSTGDDVLMGGAGSDTYVFTDGFGSDIVVDSAGERDEVAFQGGLTSTLARVSLEGTTARDLRIRFEGRPETLLIRDYLDAEGNATIERITFPDGPLWDGREIRDFVMAARATEGNDRIRGTIASETIIGGAGNDTLYSYGQLPRNASIWSDDYGSDEFIGGTGNDVLNGGSGSDLFLFSRGDGQDLVLDGGGADIIEFDETIVAADIEIRAVERSVSDPRSLENGVDIVVSIRGTDQTITLYHALSAYHNSNNSNSFRIRFADGSQLTTQDIITRALAGTDDIDRLFAVQSGSTISAGNGNDQITGYIGDDILIGGRGNDQISDIFGRDEFRFSRGDGHDTVSIGDERRYNIGSGATKTIAFDHTIALGDLRFEQSLDGQRLTIRVAGEDQSITINDFLQGMDRVRLRLINGDTYTGAQLLAFALTPTFGNDHFIGSARSETISGGDGDDVLIGGIGPSGFNYGNDILDGGAGDDSLTGKGGDDTLIGSTGDDVLSGGGGSDTYRFALGDGHDVVELDGQGDRLVFEGGIALADISAEVSEDGSDLILRVNGASQSITLRGAMYTSAIGANEVVFDGGVSTTISALILSTQVPTNGDDTIWGSYHGGLLSGGAGNDTIIGSAEDEILDGGEGDDILAGGGGNNIYRFGVGSGTDRIVSGGAGYSSLDAVEFAPGILPEQLQISASADGTEIIIAISGTTDRLIIERNAPILQNGEFRFDNNNIIWTAQYLFQTGFGATNGDDFLYGPSNGGLLEGLDGNDYLIASGGSTIFIGGRGNDRLEGNQRRTDTYRFSLGDGTDTIIDTINENQNEEHDFVEGGNILEFGEGISADDILIFDRSGNDSVGMVIMIAGSDDRIFLRYNSETDFPITEMRFADGTVLNDFEISSLMSNGTLVGSSIVGSSFDDVIDSRGAVPTVVGNGGNDTFIFNRGYGALTIDQSQTGWFVAGQPPFASTLRFSAGVSSSEVNVSSNEVGDLILSLGDGDQITLLRGRSEAPLPFPYVTEAFSGVMRFEFANGEVLEYADILRRMYEGFNGSEGGYLGPTTLVGDAFGGQFDAHGVVREIYSSSIKDSFVYGVGYGALTIHAQIPSADLYDPENVTPFVQFTDGLTLAAAAMTISESGSLFLDFGNGDVLEIANALNSDPAAEFLHGIFSYRFDGEQFSLSELIDIANEQAVAVDPGTPVTLRGDYDFNYFDPLGVGDVIDGGGGEDDITFERGYGEILVHVAPDIGLNPSLQQNSIYINFGTGIAASDIQVRTGAENELVIALGNGDVIRLQFEHDPALDLSDRTFTLPQYGEFEFYYGGAVVLNFDNGDSLYGPDIFQLIDQNDTPTIAVGNIQVDVDAPEGGALTLAGEFAFDDGDAEDSHDISIVSVSVQGVTTAVPDSDVLLSYLYTQISRDTANGAPGQARWIFGAEAGVFDYLAEGEAVTLDYVIEIADGRQGTVQSTVSVVIHGTNEGPLITGGALSATLLPAHADAGANGQIFFADSDLSQSHIVSIGAVTPGGNVSAAPSIEMARAWLNTTLVADDDGTYHIDWSFVPVGFDFSSLGLSDQLSLTYAVEVRDSSGAVATRDITISVRASQLAAGALATTAVTVFAEDGEIDLAIPANLFAHALGGNLVVSVGLADGSPIPSWLLFDGARLTGSPPANFNGALELRVTANNGTDAVHDFLPVVIEAVNDAPETGDRIADHLVASGATVDLLIPQTAFSDVDGDTLSLTAILSDGGPLPAWLEFGNGRFTGTPPAGYTGILSLRVIANDGISQVEQQFNMAIGTANTPPSLGNPLYDWIVREDEAISIALREGAFRDANGDALTITARHSNGDELPSWLTFDGTRFTGNPPQDFNGLFDVVVTASDGEHSVSDSFRLTIDPINDAPILARTLTALTIGGGGNVDFAIPADTFADVDGDTLSITALMSNGDPLPSWLNFDGSRLTGMPPLNFNGTLAIEVTASDGEATISGLFNLSINPINDAPVATNDAGYSVTAGMPLVIDSFNLILNDTDIDGDNLSLVSVSAPIGGLVNIGSDGKVVFSASSSFSGNGGFSYTITDGNQTSSATVSVIVQPDVAWTYGTAGNDTINGSANMRNRIDGLAGSDTIYGGSLNDELVGGDSNDNLYGNAGDDILRGGNGDDFLYPGLGIDLIDGGIGTDRVLYSSASSGVVFSLLNGGTAGDALGDTYVNVEHAAGSNFNDVIEGDNLANVLYGSDGNDELVGLDGNDIFQGGNGADILRGGGGNDTMIADRTDNAGDVFFGDSGNDYISIGNLDIAHGGDGNDQIDIRGSNSAVYGGSGIDDFDLKSNATNVFIDGGDGYDYLDGAGWDLSVSTLANVESITGSTDINNSFAVTVNSTSLNLSATSFIWYLDIIAGSNADTTIIGPGAASNPMPARLRIYGAAGNDSLTGSLVADHLTGGAGNDFLAGNTGFDIAYFSGAIGTYSIVTSGGTVTVVDSDPTTDGNDGIDTISSIEQLSFQGGATVNVTSPIILDLDGNGVKTIAAADSNARYDLDGDGLADDTSWIGSTEGFLFIDRDANGTVTNAGEFSFIDDVVGARSDLEGLRAFDSNKDGILSSLDAKFAEFKVWQDRDSDGAAETNEILTLSQAGVRSINLTGTVVNGSTKLGEVAVINKGSYTRTNGSTMEFLDAALTYFSSATNMPALVVRELELSQKSKRFSINFAGGELTIARNKRKGQIDARAGALGASSLLSFRNQTVGLLSPIILDLDGDGVEMRSIKKSKAAFDMNGDGALDDTGWVGNGDGFLVIDRNNDGLITHASELSFASEDPDAASDLEALAALDNNGDLVIDAKDVRSGELKVWVDADGDGVTDAGELKTLAEVGIASISLVGRNLEGRADVGDNILLGTSTFTRANGATGTVGNAVLAYRPGTDVPVGAGRANGFYNARAFLALDHSYPPDDSSNVDPNAIADNADALVELLRAGQRSSDGQFNWKLPVNINPFDHFGVSEAQLQAIPDHDGKDFVSGVAEAIENDAEFRAFATTESVGKSGTERLLALIRQDMATFGVVGSESSSPWRSGDVNRHVDFFA